MNTIRKEKIYSLLIGENNIFLWISIRSYPQLYVVINIK